MVKREYRQRLETTRWIAERGHDLAVGCVQLQARPGRSTPANAAMAPPGTRGYSSGFAASTAPTPDATAAAAAQPGLRRAWSSKAAVNSGASVSRGWR